MDVLINYLDKFGPELLVIQFGFLIILSTLFLWLWFANRRKYHNLKHVIPANVVKNYLDSIIQNSTALKSSLFRGGGLDLDNVPSVMPLEQLGGGENVAVRGAPSAQVLEELAEKKALIASLEAQLQSSKAASGEFEIKAKNNHKDLSIALEKIADLEAQLVNPSMGTALDSTHDDSALKEELATVTKERDELLERLREFEVIADDLANLKRLQQENEQLKKSLGAAAPEVNHQKEEALQAEVSELLEQVSEAVAETSGSDMSSLDEFLSEGEMTPEEKEMLAAMNEANDPTEEKKEEKPLANDDLLSEFEKMLG